MRVEGIGLIFATRFEARPFLSAVRAELVATRPFKVYTAGVNRMPIIISGIGKVAAAVACHCLIRDYGVHYVLNAGACGALHDRAGLAIGDIMRIATAREGDHTPFDRHPAPLACCNQFAPNLPAVDLVTCDRPVFEPGARAYFGRLGDVVDMEGGAIARTAALYGIPWDMVKGVSDAAGIIDHDTLKRNLQSVCEKIAQILLKELMAFEPLPTHSLTNPTTPPTQRTQQTHQPQRSTAAMPESKHSRYVITELKTDSRDLLPKAPMDPAGLDAFMKSHTKLLSLDDVVLKGSFYVECVWIWPGKDIYPETAEPNAHAHDYDEVITFFGTDYSNPNDLCGEIEIWMEDEKFMLTKSSMIFVPKGMSHCPLVIHKVDKPIFHFAAGTGPVYSQETMPPA